MIASGLCARDERDQDAGVAVAGDQRGVGAAVHRRDLDHAGQARAARRRGTQASTISRPTGRPFSCAARTLPPTMRAAKPKVVRCIST